MSFILYKRFIFALCGKDKSTIHNILYKFKFLNYYINLSFKALEIETCNIFSLDITDDA